MVDQHRNPVVRHAGAADPDQQKIRAALDLWRHALAERLAGRRTEPGETGGSVALLPDQVDLGRCPPVPGPVGDDAPEQSL